MRDNSLDLEEQGIVDSFENDEWISSSELSQEKARYSDYAKASLKKDKRINIRISERDLNELQRKAIFEGLPYQTLISSVLHKFVNGSYIENRV